jgi:cytoskeletal protein CcmA (bactofilin family)
MNAPPQATEITALLGRGTRFEGKLTFEGRVRIDGYFKGEIRSDDTLIVGEGAEVHAEIDAAVVIIRGGEVHGKLAGNIQAPSVFLDRGATFQGNCRMEALPERPSTPQSAIAQIPRA